MEIFDEIDKSAFKIMVVDDEEPILRILAKGLARAGYDCATAGGGEEALGIMAGIPIDVVVTDIYMPRMDGVELTKNIRERYDSDVIVMTGFVKDFNYENIIVRGASDFIQKPIGIEELNLRILRVLRERTILAARKRAEEENLAILDRLKKIINGTIYAMAMTIDIRDPFTAGHQRRVALLSRAIGRVLGLSRLELESISMGGVIHDLGKISVPVEILSKPSKLTEPEYEIIKTHAQAGYDILKNIDFPWPLAEITLQHHERLDGSGYPSGLKGDEIILEARIIAVADTVEAMVSHRPYRPALGVDAALDFVLERKDVEFDPLVVDACLRVFREDNFKF